MAGEAACIEHAGTRNKGGYGVLPLAELHVFLRGRPTPLTLEQVEKQQAAQERARQRNARIFREAPRND